MTALAHRLLTWYRKNKRSLPWRDHPDPYAVWVSEIMLQQTRVDAVIPYFERWLARFPDIQTLAAAPEQEVLNLWEGLGYYSRARNIHHAAHMLADEFDAQLPADVALLQTLPGIGRYTAAAIASMAFGQNVAALDGNIRRVYSRLFHIDAPLGTTRAEKTLWELAEEILPHGNAGDYNQALMDLGATICTPRSPSCEDCPLGEFCQARKIGVQHERPVRKVKKAVPQYVHAAAAIVEHRRVLLGRRPADGLLGGMWEFPNGRVDGKPAEGLAAVLESGYQLKVECGAPLCEVRHAYTHFKVSVFAFRCTLLRLASRKKLRWVAVSDLDDYPMGKVDRLIARKVAAEFAGDNLDHWDKKRIPCDINARKIKKL
ncbi:MAG: A/G-specific adenine glycosylase [Anaerolineales bacterium]|nr:A/G-specific adenine glycosylase [Anaerolineales bacterium]